MKKNIVVCMCLILSCISTYAGSYKGLEPGISTERNARDALGEPTVGRKHDALIFKKPEKGIEKVIVHFYEDSPLIKEVSLYLVQPEHKAAFKKWFGIEEPYMQEKAKDGHLVEYYLTHNVLLSYAGSDDSAPVTFFSHFDPSIFIKKEEGSQRAYLGIRLMSHEGEGLKILTVDESSPAWEAGLRVGDSLLELGTHTFYRKAIDPREFINLFPTLPVGKALPVIYRRDASEQKTLLTLQPLSGTMREEQEAAAFVVFRKGQLALNRGDAYGALELFKNAILLKPDEAAYYAALGDAYGRIGLFDLAKDALMQSVAMQPTYFPYYVLGVLALKEDDVDAAISAFKRATTIDLSHVDTWEHLGMCYYEKNNFREALQAYQKVLHLREDSPVATYYVAECYDKLHEKAQAKFFYEHYMKMHDRNEQRREAAKARIAFFDGIAVPALTGGE